MKTVQDAIDWANREEPPDIYISGHPRRTQEALLILVGEVLKLRTALVNISGQMPSVDDTENTKSRMWGIDRMAKNAVMESV